MTNKTVTARSTATILFLFFIPLTILLFPAISANAVQNRFRFVDLKARAFKCAVKKLLRFLFSEMNAFPAYPAGKMQTVLAFHSGNVLIKRFPCSFTDAAFEQPFRFKIGKISVDGTDAYVVFRQCVRDLTRGQLFVCML